MHNFNRQCKLHTVQHTTQHTMNDEFKKLKNLCMAAATVLPLSAAQQKWMRVDDDAGNVFKKSVGKEMDDKLLYCASA